MKILIVDDSTFAQIVTSNLIKKFIDDVEIHYAKDGIEGLKKYKEIRPDYVFIDLLMPNMSGRDLTILIKEYDKTARVIIVSADVQKTVKEEMEDCDILAFVNKPFNEEKAKDICGIMRAGKYGE